MDKLDTYELSLLIAKAVTDQFANKIQKKLGDKFSQEMRESYIDDTVEQLQEGIADSANSALEAILEITDELEPDEDLYDEWLEHIERRKVLHEVGLKMTELLVEYYQENGPSSIFFKEEPTVIEDFPIDAVHELLSDS